MRLIHLFGHALFWCFTTVHAAPVGECFKLYRLAVEKGVYQLREPKHFYHWFVSRDDQADERTTLDRMRTYSENESIPGIYTATDPAISCRYGLEDSKNRWRVAQVTLPKGAVLVSRYMTDDTLKELLPALEKNQCLTENFKKYLKTREPVQGEAFFNSEQLNPKYVFRESELGGSHANAWNQVISTYKNPSVFSSWGSYVPPQLDTTLNPTRTSAETIINPNWLVPEHTRIFSKATLSVESRTNEDARRITQYLQLALADSNFENPECVGMLAKETPAATPVDLTKLAAWTQSHVGSLRGIASYLEPCRHGGEPVRSAKPKH